MKKTRLVGLLAPFLFIITSQSAMAQSTIFNVPTTDTVQKGKTYFEFDFLPQMPAPEGPRTYVYNPRLIFGIASNVEAGANFLTSHSSHGAHLCGEVSTCSYFQPNVKYRYYNNDSTGVAAAAGIVWNTPLNQRDSQDSWGYIYANISKKIKKGNYGPRFTAGPYGVLGANQDPLEGPTIFLDQTRAGAIVGYEQPIHAKASIVADWFSGKNGLGYFTPGISITLPKSSVVNAGYSIGNNSYHGNDNRFLYVYYSVTF